MLFTNEKKIRELLRLRKMKTKATKPWPEIKGLIQEPKIKSKRGTQP